MNRPLDPDIVLEYCCSRFNIPKWIVISKEKRNKEEVKLRKIIVLLLLELTDLRKEEIAKIFNRKRSLVDYYRKSLKKNDFVAVACINDCKKIKEEIRNLYE